MDEEEPTLPPLPTLARGPESQGISNTDHTRKRRKQLSRTPSPAPLTSAHESSDPAFFSSDDDPSVDNYTNQNRRKKRYVGSWFHQRPASSDPPEVHEGVTTAHDSKRTLTRQIDSGIYIGSDLTDYDYELDEVMGASAPPEERLSQTAQRQALPISQAERQAQMIIQDHLDRGIDCFDFYSLGLDDVSGETIRRLHEFAYVLDVVKDVEFLQRTPELKVLLTNNSLTRLPAALFDLSFLTVLSLRGNQLTELPPSICKLANLESLNLAQNRLHTLPAELLDLLQPGGKLTDLTLFPNPLAQPKRPFQYVAPAAAEDLIDRRPGFAPQMVRYGFPHQKATLEALPKLLSRRIARSPVQLLSSSGVVLSSFRLSLGGDGNGSVGGVPTTDVFGDDETGDVNDGGPVTPRARFSQSQADSLRPSRVPSLVEAALRSYCRSRQPPQSASCIPDDLDHLRALLRRAVRQRDHGGVTCSHCRRVVVVPAMEWVEWRELRATSITKFQSRWLLSVGQLCQNEAEMAVPFLRRACSWRCGPDGLEEASGTEKPDQRLWDFDCLPVGIFDLQISVFTDSHGSRLRSVRL